MLSSITFSILFTACFPSINFYLYFLSFLSLYSPCDSLFCLLFYSLLILYCVQPLLSFSSFCHLLPSFIYQFPAKIRNKYARLCQYYCFPLLGSLHLSGHPKISTWTITFIASHNTDNSHQQEHLSTMKTE